MKTTKFITKSWNKDKCKACQRYLIQKHTIKKHPSNKNTILYQSEIVCEYCNSLYDEFPQREKWNYLKQKYEEPKGYNPWYVLPIIILKHHWFAKPEEIYTIHQLMIGKNIFRLGIKRFDIKSTKKR